jgi:hypothetical protein
MMSKLQREHDAQAAMLAFRTGLSASMCEAWIEAPIAKSAEAIKAAKVMAFFSLKHSASCLKTAVLASGLLLISAQGHAEPGSEGSFLGLSGHWSGAGTVTMTDGATERIRCKAAYAVNATGKAVQQTLRCASDSYRFEIISNVISEGGSLSGSWAEATRGASGNISGRASGAEIVVNVAGAGFTAHLDLRTQGDRQSVTIRPQGGTDVTAVSIALRKG